MADLSSEDKHGRVLNFKDHRVRVVDIDGKPWFVAADLPVALGYSDNNLKYHMRNNIADDERGVVELPTLGGPQNLTVVSESGLYKLITKARARNPSVVKFQDWVTRDVLPAIRKDGMYVKGEEKIDLTDDDALDRLPGNRYRGNGRG